MTQVNRASKLKRQQNAQDVDVAAYGTSRVIAAEADRSSGACDAHEIVYGTISPSDVFLHAIHAPITRAAVNHYLPTTDLILPKIILQPDNAQRLAEPDYVQSFCAKRYRRQTS